MRGPAFKGTPNSIAPYQPAISTPHIQRAGMPLGYELRTGKVVVVWFWSMPTEATVFSIEGLKDAGKSAFQKSVAPRLLVFQAKDHDGNPELMRVRMHARKSERGRSEIAASADALHAPLYDLGTATDINLLGLFWHEADLIEVSLMLAQEINEAPLPEKVPEVIMMGVRKMLSEASDIPSTPLLESLIRGLSPIDLKEYRNTNDRNFLNSIKEELDLRPKLLETLQLSLDTVDEEFDQGYVDAKHKAANLFNRMHRGDYGRSFGAKENLYDILTDHVQMLNWENMPIKGRNLLEAVLMKAQASAIVRKKNVNPFGLDLSKIIPHANFKDEEASAVTSRIHMAFDADYVNKSRAYSTADFRSLQYDSQLSDVGDLSPELGYYAKQIEQGTAARWLFRQPDDEEYLQRFSKRGMSDIDVAQLPQLQQGQAIIWMKDRKPLYYQHVLTSADWPVVQSNSARSAMNEGIPIWTDEEFRRQAERYGVVAVGG